MKKNERDYAAKGREIVAKYVEGTSFLTKGKTYIALSDVVDNRVTVEDDSGQKTSYLASHFVSLKNNYIRQLQKTNLEMAETLKQIESEILCFRLYLQSEKFTGVQSDGSRKDWIATGDVLRWLEQLRAKTVV